MLKRILVCLLFVLVVTDSTLANVSEAIAKCRELADSLYRLTCYDEIALAGGKAARLAEMPKAVSPVILVSSELRAQPENLDSGIYQPRIRCLLDIAQSLKGQTFTTAQLAFRGNAKFQMSGAYFRQLGEERSWQNPVFTIRTLPQSLETNDGRPAFNTWTGGWLGVVQRQMEDHNDLHRRWYLSELFGT